MAVVGKEGPGNDCFNDPAGTAVDDVGNVIIADSKYVITSLAVTPKCWNL